MYLGKIRNLKVGGPSPPKKSGQAWTHAALQAPPPMSLRNT